MRKTLKLSLTLVLAVVMLFAVAIIASAETTLIASGNVGPIDSETGNFTDVVTYEIVKDTETATVTLTFSGNGAIADFTKPEQAPYYKYRKDITNLVFEDGITRIGSRACYAMSAVKIITIPDSVETIGQTAFRGWKATDLYLGNGLTKIEKDAFTPYNKTTKVHLSDLANWCEIEFVNVYSNPAIGGGRSLYLGDELITKLVFPSEVTRIGKYAFAHNTKLTEVVFHDNIKFIGNLAFAASRAIKKITFDNCTFETSDYCFKNCTGLKSVYINNIKAWVGNEWASTSSNPLHLNASVYINGERFLYTKNPTSVKLDPKLLVIPKGTEVMQSNAFYKRTEVSGVVIPSTVTTINGDPLNVVSNGSATFRNVYGVSGTAAEAYAAKKSGARFKQLGVDLIFVDVNGLSVAQGDVTLKLGQTITATATLTPSDATDKHVIWTSSDLDVVRVSAGVVSAIGYGTATVTASTTDGEFYDSFVVTVAAETVEVTGVTLNTTSAELAPAEKLQLTATVEPDNATNKTVTWTSSNTKAATVDANGLVTAIADGEATITATAGNFSATCAIVVETPFVAVTEITLNKAEATITEEDTLQLTATVKPTNATEPKVTWTSDAEAIATVDDNGLVTAIKAGTATITAKAGEKTATCVITVEAKFIAVTEITLDKAEATITEEDTLQLTATVKPTNATEPKVTWTSDAEAIATVDANGLVTAIKAGTATITAKAGEKTATCVITVEAKFIAVTGITLDKAEATITEEDTLQLTATVLPADATEPKVTWTSDAEAIATVDANGLVTAIKAGTATITAKAGEKTATCVITVEAKFIAVTEITLDKTEATITEEDTLQLTATVLPADATEPKVTWTSDAEAIATVDANGLVTAIKAGTATITAKAGEKTATCVITVEAKFIAVTGITLDTTSAELEPEDTLQLTATVLPADATEPKVTWTSSNNAVATVDANGLVTAIADGEATITAQAGDFSATCAIVVNTPYVAVEEITIDVEELEVVVGDTYEFVVTFNPANATNKALVWESTNEDVASVDENGVLTAIEEGVTIITATSVDNEDCMVECIVFVSSGIAVEGIALNKTTASMTSGDVIELEVIFTPANATNKNVSWTTSSDAVATVEDGVVTAIGAGVATITATSADGEFTATCKIIVTTGNEVPPIEWDN